MVNDQIPVLTLVIKSYDSSKEVVSTKHKNLLDTLSTLCSFLSIDDFCSFVYSDNFVSLMSSNPDIKFEIGSYLEHESTLEFTKQMGLVELTDKLSTGSFIDNSVVCSNSDELSFNLNKWLLNVHNV